ncbi:DnaJ domain-containing protein [Methylomicrobium sp. Wu6]|uniref:DnaJ domain-containing protein n=1 Tax=Methylomicrobium sp. Wu6 TaxID=3107928 RepID=UPI002DD64193|nr:DnaJ domain-containing protein [Methylomicrobium sp. Wu6]MEC4747447.1 DnaJ domain-containing protein [Methylomicrobium sp. Wu6]
MNKDYYRVLGLSHHAEDVVIRAAFKLLAHRYHPDKRTENQEQANQRMSEINEAYNHLSDSLLKARYDQQHNNFADDSDFYQVLGLLNNVDAKMIDAAYSALAHKYSNSTQPALREKRLNEINQAYQILADTKKRKIYDLKFKTQSFLFQSRQSSGLSLWKIYLAYNVSFWLLIAVILGLSMLIHN